MSEDLLMQTNRANRLHADIPVDVRLPTGTYRKPGRVRNLNDGGMLLEHNSVLRAGDSVGVEFPPTSDRGRVVVLGEVAWSDRVVMGVRVCGMMPHHRVRYERLISSLQGGQSLLG
jgi:hypothetical protein